MMDRVVFFLFNLNHIYKPYNEIRLITSYTQPTPQFLPPEHTYQDHCHIQSRSSLHQITAAMQIHLPHIQSGQGKDRKMYTFD